MLLPLALYGVERRKTWLAAAALASIPLSGQVHLALGAIPFVLVYALARRRPWLGAISAGAASVPRPRLGADPPRRRRAPLLGGRSTTRPRSATSSPATRASSNASPTSAGSSRSPPCSGSGACVSETQSPPGAGSRSCSGWARSSPACSRSARTCPDMACSGGIRPCTRPGARAHAPDRLPLPRSAWRLPRSLVVSEREHVRPLSSPPPRASSSRPTWGGALRPARRRRGQRRLWAGRGRTGRPGCASCPRWRPTTYAGSVSSTRCRRRASGRSATRPRRRRRRSGSPGSSPSEARDLGVSVVVEYRDGVPQRIGLHESRETMSSDERSHV